MYITVYTRKTVSDLASYVIRWANKGNVKANRYPYGFDTRFSLSKPFGYLPAGALLFS